MRLAALALAGVLLPAPGAGADASRCRLGKGLYDERLALQKGPARPRAESALRPVPGGDPGTLQEIDQAYAGFLAEIADATARKDLAALEACCDEAARDRAGVLFCRLAVYLAQGRTDSKPFLDAFPGNRKDTALLWDLDAIAGHAGELLFPPKGPGYKLIDELFLLVLDERDPAIARYFNLAAGATAETATYMDSQIVMLLRESPAVVVNQWLVLRRYRPKLKAAIQTLRQSAPAAEMQKITRAVRAFCAADNPDCPDILKLYEGK